MRSFKRWAIGIVAALVLVALVVGAFTGDARAGDRFFLSLGGAVVGAIIAAAVQRRHRRPMTKESLLVGIFLGSIAASPLGALAAVEAGGALGYGAGQGALLALAAAGLWFALGVHGVPKSPPASAGTVTERTEIATGGGVAAPRGFYFVLAGCAVALTLAAAALTLVRVVGAFQPRWELREGYEIFNPRTGVVCMVTDDPGQTVCIDLRKAERRYKSFVNYVFKPVPGPVAEALARIRLEAKKSAPLDSIAEADDPIGAYKAKYPDR